MAPSNLGGPSRSHCDVAVMSMSYCIEMPYEHSKSGSTFQTDHRNRLR